jgi:2-haloacid dehalogenase
MPALEAVAFDMYGTLVDPLGISKRLERYVGDRASRVAEVWRQKQLELTWRLTVMERYEDFEQVTRKALDHALAVHSEELGADEKDGLIAQYDELERFPDVLPGLERLRDAGYAMAVFSNGTPAMLDAVVGSSGLRAYVGEIVSVDEVGAYKPAPAVYRHLARRLGRPVEDVYLVSSNPFDVVGGQAVGLRAAWVARGGGPFDPLGTPPAVTVGSLSELAGALGSQSHP